jgi:biotin transporter BioY
MVCRTKIPGGRTMKEKVLTQVKGFLIGIGISYVIALIWLLVMIATGKPNMAVLLVIPGIWIVLVILVTLANVLLNLLGVVIISFFPSESEEGD